MGCIHKRNLRLKTVEKIYNAFYDFKLYNIIFSSLNDCEMHCYSLVSVRVFTITKQQFKKNIIH